MSERLINALHTNNEDSETKEICNFLSDFIETYSFLLTHRIKVQFRINFKKKNDNGIVYTNIVLSHPTDVKISATHETTYSFQTVISIISKHGGKFKATHVHPYDGIDEGLVSFKIK